MAMSATESRASHALHLSEAVPLLHGVVGEVARALDVRILFIKGPILTAQGLRGAHQSVDVDVLVDPARVVDLRRGLETLGWAVRVPSTTARVLPQHSSAFAHPFWPCEIDVHDRFPGFLADPTTTFAALWEHRTTAAVAGREVPCPTLVAHAAIACLHVLRNAEAPGRREELAELVHVAKAAFDADACAQFGVLAARTGSVGTLRPVLEALGLPLVTDEASDVALTAWRIQASSPGVRSVGWVAQLGRTPFRRWPGAVLHAVLLTEAEIRDAYPHAAPGAWGLFRARLHRLGRGLRDVPRACRIVRRARREKVPRP
jgi:hypothetical protein